MHCRSRRGCRRASSGCRFRSGRRITGGRPDARSAASRCRGRDPLGTAPQGLLRDFGFGLRLGGNRSAQANVRHIDVAFPLDGDSSIRKVQFLLETKHPC
jgi:hypothetical protein